MFSDNFGLVSWQYGMFFLVFCHLAHILQALLDPGLHGVSQLDHQGLGQGYPDLLDGLDELGKCSDVLLRLDLALDDRPQVFNRVEVGQIAQPVNQGKLLPFQKLHHFLTLMAWCPIVQVVCCLVVVHPEDQLLLEHRHEPAPVHGGLGGGGQEVQGVTAAVSA